MERKLKYDVLRTRGTKSLDFMNVKNVGSVSYLTDNEPDPLSGSEAEIDYEIGPDESMEDTLDTAELLEKIIGEEEVEKRMDF